MKNKKKLASTIISMCTDFKLGNIDEETFGDNINIMASLAKDNYDSKADTLLHIKRVSELMTMAAKELIDRANVHDDSKLKSPEKELFDEYTPKLKDCTYGSDEYKEYLKGLKVALDHHYANNSHHPEHYENGVNDMNLFDIIEMFFDWTAATERHADGDIYKSIDINKKRFKMSEQLAQIFRNTVDYIRD